MFVKFCNNPRGNLRAGDCVIRAICAASGDTWEKIYTELSAEGYYMGDWANNNAVWDSYLRRRGYKRYICPNDCPSCYSVSPVKEKVDYYSETEFGQAVQGKDFAFIIELFDELMSVLQTVNPRLYKGVMSKI